MDSSTPGSSSPALSKALQGDVNSQFELACELEAEQDTECAGAWFKKAALQGHTEAAYRVGLLCLQGDESTRNDACFWLLKAASQQHAGAEFQLGLLYERGIGVRLDPDEALRWLRLSAQHGNIEAKAKIDSMNFFLDELEPPPPSKRKGSIA